MQFSYILLALFGDLSDANFYHFLLENNAGKGKAREKSQRKSSMFLNLPPELRNQVYACLFASTTFVFGIKSTSIGTKIMRPAPNSLAVLHTCRQVNHEAGT